MAIRMAGTKLDSCSITRERARKETDLESAHHNGRILRHQENGDAIRLFTGTSTKTRYSYEGELALIDYGTFRPVTPGKIGGPCVYLRAGN